MPVPDLSSMRKVVPPPVLAVKLAVTLVLAFIVTVVVVLLPLAPPLQLVNVKPEAGVAVNVTTVPGE